MPTRRPTDAPQKPERTPAPADKIVTPKRAAPSSKVSAKPSQARLGVSEDERRAMIAAAAYLRAERRGFIGGSEIDDWVAAEAEVDALLRAGGGLTSQ